MYLHFYPYVRVSVCVCTYIYMYMYIVAHCSFHCRISKDQMIIMISVKYQTSMTASNTICYIIGRVVWCSCVVWIRAQCIVHVCICSSTCILSSTPNVDRFNMLYISLPADMQVWTKSMCTLCLRRPCTWQILSYHRSGHTHCRVFWRTCTLCMHTHPYMLHVCVWNMHFWVPTYIVHVYTSLYVPCVCLSCTCILYMCLWCARVWYRSMVWQRRRSWRWRASFATLCCARYSLIWATCCPTRAQTSTIGWTLSSPSTLSSLPVGTSGQGSTLPASPTSTVWSTSSDTADCLGWGVTTLCACIPLYTCVAYSVAWGLNTYMYM